MEYNYSGIETTFGIDVLKSFWHHESFVFSPISLLFALSMVKPDNFDPIVSNQYTSYGVKSRDVKNYLQRNLSDIVVQLDDGTSYGDDNAQNHSKINFNGAWESKLMKHVSGAFHSSRARSTPMKFLSMDNHFLLNVDDAFKMISIPYNDWNLQFVILLPAQRFGLRKAIKKLTKTRLDELLNDATLEFVNLSVPKMNRLSLLINGKQLGLQSPIKINLQHKQTPKIAGLLYRPENREPYYFQADHPFIFGVLRKNHPVFLGVFRGL